MGVYAGASYFDKLFLPCCGETEEISAWYLIWTRKGII